MPKLTKEERKQRMAYLPGGINALVEKLATLHGGKSPVNASAVGMILRGERGDRYGVQKLFIALTTAEEDRINAQVERIVSPSAE